MRHPGSRHKHEADARSQGLVGTCPAPGVSLRHLSTPLSLPLRASQPPTNLPVSPAKRSLLAVFTSKMEQRQMTPRANLTPSWAILQGA